MTNNLAEQRQVLVKMVLDGWHSKTSQLTKLLAELTDEQLMREVAPGRNRGFYLVGHLAALADSIFPLLGHEKVALHLFKPYVQTPDKQNAELPGVTDLRQDWVRVTAALAETMAGMGVDEWFKKHTAVSEEDFANEPHRNKLNVVLSRISHINYHIGQLQFLKSKDFSTTIWVEQEPELVYETILDVRSWWSGLFEESFKGKAEKLGDEFSFIAGGGMHATKQRLVELVPNKRIAWLVTDANLSFVDKTDEWKNTRITFEISEDGGKTKIVFTHAGLVPSFQCYDSCAPAWTQYMHQQLTAAIKAAKLQTLQ